MFHHSSLDYRELDKKYFGGIEIVGDDSFIFNITLVLAFGEEYAPFYYNIIKNNTKIIISNDKILKMASREGYITEVNPVFASLYTQEGKPNLKSIFSALLHEARHQYDYKKFGYTSEISARMIEAAFNQDIAISEQEQIDFIKKKEMEMKMK